MERERKHLKCGLTFALAPAKLRELNEVFLSEKEAL